MQHTIKFSLVTLALLFAVTSASEAIDDKSEQKQLKREDDDSNNQVTPDNQRSDSPVAEHRTIGGQPPMHLKKYSAPGQVAPTYAAMSRVPANQQPAYRPQHIIQPVTPYQPVRGISPIYQPQDVAYQQQLGMQVSSYQPQNVGLLNLFNPPKEKSEKKATESVKDTKPDYYPKESSYSTIPEQPNDASITNIVDRREVGHTARFVADPTRNQIIEEVSPSELQQLTMRHPHPYTLVQQPVPMPGYNFNYIQAVPGLHPGVMPSQYLGGGSFNGQPETATVKYTQTEHGFMDRVWGEVMTMREAITSDFFGAIPNMFRNLWNIIVGTVSDASARMFNAIDSDATARLFSAVPFDWTDVLQFALSRLT